MAAAFLCDAACVVYCKLVVGCVSLSSYAVVLDSAKGSCGPTCFNRALQKLLPFCLLPHVHVGVCCRHACSTRWAMVTCRVVRCVTWRIIFGGCSYRTQGSRGHMTQLCRHCAPIILSQADGLRRPQRATVQLILTPMPQVSCALAFTREGQTAAFYQ